MNNKTNHQGQEVKKRGFNFLYEVKQELAKTSWTPRKELFSLTRVVVTATFVFGFILFFVDMSLKNIMQVIKFCFQGLFG